WGGLHYTGGEVDGYSTNVVPALLDLPRVQPRPDVDTDLPDAPDNRFTATDRARRAIERGQYAVAGRVHEMAAVSRQLVADPRVVLVEQLPPAPVAQLGGPLGGAYDIGEENGGEDTVRFGSGPGAGQELLDLVETPVDVAGVEEVVVTAKLDILGAADVGRKVQAVAEPNVAVAPAVQHEGWGMKRPEKRPTRAP